MTRLIKRWFAGLTKADVAYIAGVINEADGYFTSYPRPTLIIVSQNCEDLKQIKSKVGGRIEFRVKYYMIKIRGANLKKCFYHIAPFAGKRARKFIDSYNTVTQQKR
jgi:hypothetical protein